MNKSGRNLIHGMARRGKNRSSEYTAWDHMRRRCNNPNDRYYKNYGARGIKVCERWNSFKNFLEDMGNKPSTNLSIDRIDNNGDYEPSNCRWATVAEQVSNRRVTQMAVFKGVSKPVADWAKSVGISRITLLSRIKRGWDIEKAMTTPLLDPLDNLVWRQRKGVKRKP